MAFNARWCNVCPLFKSEMDVDAKLFTCHACRLVQYCSEGHKKIDWPLHKDLCRPVQTILDRYEAPHIFAIDKLSGFSESLESRVLQVKLLLRIELGRVLHDHEEQLTSYPNLCKVCFKTSFLQVCRNCQGVSYCSEKCKRADEKHHDKICHALRLFYCPYKLKIDVTNPSVDITLFTRVKRLQESNLLDVLQYATQFIISDEPYKSLEEFKMFSDMANFSCIATICYALKCTEMNNLGRTKFVIYVVGAEEEHTLYFSEIHTKFFFLQYPQITELNLSFIGPNLVDIKKNQFIYDFQGKKRCVNIAGHKGLFQHFCKLYRIDPSIIICFNCGFSEKVDVLKESGDCPTPSNEGEQSTGSCNWHGGICEMAQAFEVPVVFTSFTLMEAQFDYGVLAQIVQSDLVLTRLDRIIQIHQNPYRDPRPFRNIVTTDDEEIYYRNGYIQAIYTRNGYVK